MKEYQIQNMLYHWIFGTSSLLLPNYTPKTWFECDLFAVTKAGYMREYEIKTSRADFKADARKTEPDYYREDTDRKPIDDTFPWVKRKGRNKHQALAEHDPTGPTMFWYVTPEGLEGKRFNILWDQGRPADT